MPLTETPLPSAGSASPPNEWAGPVRACVRVCMFHTVICLLFFIRIAALTAVYLPAQTSQGQRTAHTHTYTHTKTHDHPHFSIGRRTCSCNSSLCAVPQSDCPADSWLPSTDIMLAHTHAHNHSHHSTGRRTCSCDSSLCAVPQFDCPADSWLPSTDTRSSNIARSAEITPSSARKRPISTCRPEQRNAGLCSFGKITNAKHSNCCCLVSGFQVHINTSNYEAVAKRKIDCVMVAQAHTEIHVGRIQSFTCSPLCNLLHGSTSVHKRTPIHLYHMHAYLKVSASNRQGISTRSLLCCLLCGGTRLPRKPPTLFFTLRQLAAQTHTYLVAFLHVHT